jgi:TM2 domain-containing membrane protein YozV
MADDSLHSATHTHMQWRETEKQVTSAPPAASKRLPAGILAILLGTLGAHKFFLGYPVAGVMMLLASGLSFAFAPQVTAVVALVGLLEGVLYLIKSDDDFVSTYQAHRRSWF